MATTPNMGLTTWPNLSDVFSHTALAANFTALDQHDHTSGKGVPVGAGGIGSLAVGTSQLQDVSVTTAKLADLGVTTAKINDLGVTTGKLADLGVTTGKLAAAGVTADKLADAARLGLTDSGVNRRGVSVISTTQSTGSTTYTTLTTPDTVSVTLPTNGLIFIAYHATWQESVSLSAKAAIFIGANQIKTTPISAGGAPAVQETVLGALNGASAAVVAVDRPLYTALDGLRTHPGQNNGGYSGDVTTGQLLGPGFTSGNAIAYTPAGLAVAFAAAGTYAISVQYKVDAIALGTVTAKNRNLMVWTLGF